MKLVYLVIINLGIVLSLNQFTFALTAKQHKSPQVIHQTKKQEKKKTIKLALATKKNKPTQQKLASAIKNKKPNQQKLASAVKSKKPTQQKLASVIKNNKQIQQKLASAIKNNKTVQQKLASAIKSNKPLKQKSTSAIKSNKPLKQKLASENKKNKMAQLKKGSLLKKNNLTNLKLSLESKKINKLAQKPLVTQKVNRNVPLKPVFSSLVSQLNNIIRDAGENAVIGVSVKSMRNKEFIYSRNLYKPLTPASTLKILTAEAALLFLKPEYRFPTQLLTDAQTVKDGVLQGNLYVVLSGDPTLTYNDLVDLMLNLRTHQIYAISGNVYIDNTAYDQSFYGPDWEWKDKSYCYAAPISASIINHNCLPFKVTPAKVAGQSARVETSPNFFYPNIRNYVVTKSNRASCSVHLSPNLSSGLLEIGGCMQKGKQAWGLSYVVSDVPEYNRALFKSVLNQLAIKIYGSVTFGSAPKKSYMIAYHASEPLSQLIYDMLKKSDNVIAASLFKKLGQLYTHQPGSWENGSFAVSAILSKHAGMNTFGLKILDGSGLSPSNLASPLQMMQVLDFAYHHGPTNEAFISALPIGGIDGTLKHRMGNIARKVRAKTGTISGVVSLAGYVVSADKEIFAFVIMVNGNKSMTWKYKEMEDRIVTVLARYNR